MNSSKPRHLEAKHRLREVWLDEAMGFVRRHFEAVGYDVPEYVRCGVGWPSKSAFGKARRIGEAWSNACSADQSHEIIISIYLDDPLKVLEVLIHETIHVTIGVEHGHRKPFKVAMGEVGLCGKATATEATPELQETLKAWVKELGPYPHARLDGRNRKKQTTRMLGLTCPTCGCKIRTTQTWLDTYDEFPCPCGDTFQENT